MIDTSRESMLTLNAAAQVVPGKPHVGTLARWIRFGIRGVRLESALIGGRRFVSTEAIARFVAHLSNGAVISDQTVPTARKNQMDDRQVDELGIR